MHKKVTDLRITSGLYKGLRLRSPRSTTTHPMGSREKLALFNMLGPDLSGMAVLDAYAGSGALGLEALSRGAARADFVESNHAVAKTLTDNLHSLGVSTGKVYVCSVSQFLTNTLPDQYDLIFADPPYDNYHPEEIMKLSYCLKPAGRLVLSHPAWTEPPVFPELDLLVSRQYAAARITIYQKNSPKT